MQKRKKRTGLIIILSIITVLIITVVGAAGIYSRFGGFGTGECANTEEFSKYAVPVSELCVPDEAQIVALGEATHGNREQVVAANIDTAFICMSLNNNFNIRRLERYLSVTYDSGATPVAVLTKSDLCPNVEEKIAEVQSAAPGVDVLAVSSLDGDCEAVMKYILPGRTVAFIGSSGVGKSTLINKLTGTDSIATREIGSDGKGRHTTTHRELFTLSNGAFVIDTPGMRELGMWDSGDGIDAAFADIEKLSRACRYSDCTHTSEPGCAVLRAFSDGELDAARLASYRKLKTENEYAADNSRYLEAKRSKFKEIAKINRSGRKNRY